MLFFTTRIVCNVNVFPRAVAIAAIACVDCLSPSTRVRKKINRCKLNIILKPSRNHLCTKISLNLHLKQVNHSLNNGNIAQGPLKRNITAVTPLYSCNNNNNNNNNNKNTRNKPLLPCFKCRLEAILKKLPIST